MKKDIILLLAVILTISACKSLLKTGDKPAEFPAFDREAHRGGRGLMPENTIPAMLNAIDIGVETIEMDTHISGDGKVVLSHDDFVNPLFTLNPAGKEIADAEAKQFILFKMSYAEIARYDVGWKDYPKYPRQKKIKVVMPLLTDLIDSVQLHLKKTGKNQVFYNIETKCSAADDGLYNPDPETFVSLLMEVIIRKKIARWVVIQSFDKRTIQIINKKYPGVRTSYLIETTKSLDENLADLGYIPFIYSPNIGLVTPDLVKRCHEKGMKVIPWTLNTPKQFAEAKAMGVDGIITDYPDLLMNKH